MHTPSSGLSNCRPYTPTRHSVPSTRYLKTTTAVVPQALPKRRRAPRKKQRDEPPKQLSDEELLRELNSTHLWLPEADADFGLDDVAAHVASRNQAQVVDVSGAGSSSSSGQKGKGKKGSQSDAAADPKTLSDIDPTSGQPMPEWVQDLKQAGFDVLSRDGQLFLQRGTITPQQQQRQARQQPQQQQRQLRARSAAAEHPSGLQQPAQTAAAAGSGSQPPGQALQVSDRSLSVRTELDPAVWQAHIHNLNPDSRAQDSQAAAAAAAAMTSAGAWYASPLPATSAGSSPSSSSSSSSSSTSSMDEASDTPSTSSGSVSNTETASSSDTGSSSVLSSFEEASRFSSSLQMSATKVQRTLLSFQHPNQLFALLRAVFPAWAANGCWLVSQSGPGVVSAPTPAEAAAAVKGLALAARRARLNAVQLQSLAREPMLTGLVECLRLTPPRCPPEQPPDLSRRLWSIAKAYWMQAGATTAAAAAAQQARLAGALAGLKGGLNPGALQGGGLNQLNPTTGVKGGPVLGSLLVQLQSQGGGAVSKQQLAAAQALVAAGGEDTLRCTAVVSALWGMAAIGGPLFFQQELDALCQIAQAKFSRWGPCPSELSDVLWALAHARHWTPLLTQLESSILAAGGPPACTAAEAVTSIWAFAVLGHTPQQLLQQLDTHGWTVKAAADKSQAPQLQNRPPAASTSSSSCSTSSGDMTSSSSDMLAALRDSQLCTLAWSLACLSQVDGSLFRAVWSEVCSRGPALAADTRQAVQLAQAALAIQLEGSYQPQELLPGQGTSELLSAAAGVFAQQGAALQAQTAHSSYQRSIAGTLARLRVMHVLEDTSTGYAVDITIPSMRVAVEADGPSHFSRTPGPSGRLLQLGATAMKRRHLQQLGWTVVNVPYSDWDKQVDEQQRVGYLKQRIAQATKEGAAAAAAGAQGAGPQ